MGLNRSLTVIAKLGISHIELLPDHHVSEAIMAGRYVPPHLRNKSVSNVKPELPPEPPISSDASLTLEEINNYFWPIKDLDGENNNSHSLHIETKGRTLHDSMAREGQLAYVILYWEANPRWESDNIIFTKSRLDLLPKAPTSNGATAVNPGEKETTDGTKNDEISNGSPHQNREANACRPIAVFKEVSSKRVTRDYQFEGWYKIERISFLEPHSPELVRMLEQKWSKTDKRGFTKVQERTGSGWNESLGYRWAVLKLAEHEAAKRELGSPKIERLLDRSPKPNGARAPRKSVNEMLAEMRLKDSQSDGAVAKS